MKRYTKTWKLIPRIAGCLCLLAGLTGCTDEVLIPDDIPEGQAVQVLANVSDMGANTADGIYDHSDFESGDKIRIKKTTIGSATTTQADYTYSTSKSGTWSAVSSSLKLEAGATYRAFYPASDNPAIQENQSALANYKSSDRMETPAVYPSTGVLDFTGSNAFVHQNTKLTLKFELTNTTTYTGNISISGNGIISGGSATETITLYTSSNTLNSTDAGKELVCSGILYPKTGTSTDITIALTLDGVLYKTTLSCPLAASTHYVHTLTIQNDILVPVGSQIAGWQDRDIYTGPITKATREGGVS